MGWRTSPGPMACSWHVPCSPDAQMGPGGIFEPPHQFERNDYGLTKAATNLLAGARSLRPQTV